MTGSLKESHPQKYYLKIISHFLYYFGLGEFWYEKLTYNYIQKLIYKLWVITSNSYIFLMILNEFLAYRKDLNSKEKGIPIRTEVTYFPNQEYSGFSVNLLRFLIQFHWWFLLAIICARKIQMSFGKLYTVQVVESISMLAICLLKLTTSVQDIASLVKNFMFISCVLLLNGTYMMSGGDVTYEASLISDSVFHCGWEYGKSRRGLRSLVVVTLQQSQVPIRMTAFGVLSLSYNSFITVLRLSYSFFAVMY
ncbi:PREDICTED: uncharacterized protein LOC106104750 [Papilio polytes]|uniref:uncharacterized protein LOC106104750 n=1 Tax=Papilio polytes TaxID=76194 RepID=UPI0006762359|nr:PREDICTED: uncharacterized protein LOC106104750 [Papilio polytes]